MSEAGWLEAERAELAVDRILDAAAAVFQEHGVGKAGMEDVARAAGCSRATVYRYFEDRKALRTAFVHRETRRIAGVVASKIAAIDDPAARIVEGVMQSVAEVRARPALHAWFASRNAEVTAAHVRSSSVIHGLAAGLVGGDGGDGRDGTEESYRALWLVRTIVSLLQTPGRDEGEERALLERFVGPVLADGRRSPGRAGSPSPRRRR